MADTNAEEKPKCTFFKKKLKRSQQSRRRRDSSDEKRKPKLVTYKLCHVTGTSLQLVNVSLYFRCCVL